MTPSADIPPVSPRWSEKAPDGAALRNFDDSRKGDPATSLGRLRLYIAVRIPYIARSGGPEVLKSAANAGLGLTIYRGLRELHTYHSPLDLVRERSPERPVALVRPGAVAVAARWFRANFTGDVLYAVKTNPSPWMIRALAQNGVTAFDVASIPEIEAVVAHAPGARPAFMHPVKSRAAIAAAYHDYGVRTFALDSHEALAKIIECAGGAKDLNLIVRLDVEAAGAAYKLSGKFGVAAAGAPALLLAARRATQDLMGVSFH